MAEPRLIRKYANRKLYDTVSSRYVTLAGIARLVHQGLGIQVVERESGRDITPLVLSQIVMTEEKRGAGPGDGAQRGQALLDYVRRTLNVPASLVSGEVERRREDFESIVDLAIARGLKRLNIPTRRDIERINRKLDDLADGVSGLAALAQASGKRAAPKAGAAGVARPPRAVRTSTRTGAV
ncbi:MAG: polyhydroxyalkanoate synthesis regulator DNA-binding domain-containing protein [Candidatus Dormibacterales bacterium]